MYFMRHTMTFYMKHKHNIYNENYFIIPNLNKKKNKTNQFKNIY